MTIVVRNRIGEGLSETLTITDRRQKTVVAGRRRLHSSVAEQRIRLPQETVARVPAWTTARRRIGFEERIDVGVQLVRVPKGFRRQFCAAIATYFLEAGQIEHACD